MIDYILSVPYVADLALELADSSVADRVRVRMPHTQRLDNGAGTAHGGALATLIDLTGSAACWNGYDFGRGERGATLSLTVNFVRATRTQGVVATGRCVRRAQDLAFAEVEVATDSGDVVATGSMVYRFAG